MEAAACLKAEVLKWAENHAILSDKWTRELVNQDIISYTTLLQFADDEDAFADLCAVVSNALRVKLKAWFSDKFPYRPIPIPKSSSKQLNASRNHQDTTLKTLNEMNARIAAIEGKFTTLAKKRERDPSSVSSKKEKKPKVDKPSSTDASSTSTSTCWGCGGGHSLKECFNITDENERKKIVEAKKANFKKKPSS
jgi:hypothetical protein